MSIYFGPKCKNCEHCKLKEKKCDVDNEPITETQLYQGVGMCDKYIPSIEYLKMVREIQEEEYW